MGSTGGARRSATITGYRLASVVSLVVTGLALGLIALFTGVGTLFFDDPHASYPEFLAFMGGMALRVAVVALACGIGAFLLRRAGLARVAVAVACGPALFVVLGTVWILLPSH